MIESFSKIKKIFLNFADEEKRLENEIQDLAKNLESNHTSLVLSITMTDGNQGKIREKRENLKKQFEQRLEDLKELKEAKNKILEMEEVQVLIDSMYSESLEAVNKLKSVNEDLRKEIYDLYDLIMIKESQMKKNTEKTVELRKDYASFFSRKSKKKKQLPGCSCILESYESYKGARTEKRKEVDRFKIISNANKRTLALLKADEENRKSKRSKFVPQK